MLFRSTDGTRNQARGVSVAVYGNYMVSERCYVQGMLGVGALDFDMNRYVSAAKAREKLGWRPRLGLSEALDWTVDWYRQQPDINDVEALCLRQICEYERKAA